MGRGLVIVGTVIALAASAGCGGKAAKQSEASKPARRVLAGTASCATTDGVEIYAIAYGHFGRSAVVVINTGPLGHLHNLVGVHTDERNYILEKGCDRTKTRLRFTHRGLTSRLVVQAGKNSPEVVCRTPRRVLVRYRIGFTSSRKPAAATIAVWTRRKKSSRLREIGYVQWSVTYYSQKAACGTYD